MIIDTRGDLIQMALNGEFDCIGHGCNTKKTMGAGIALQIANTFPEAYNADLLFPNPALGINSYAETTQIGPNGLPMIVANMYTQLNPGRYSKSITSNDTYQHRITAIGQCFMRLISDYPYAKTGIPYIGAGLAGLRWDDIRSVLNKLVPTDFDLTIVEYAP